MITSEKKNFERKFFKNLRNKSSAIDIRNVEIIFLETMKFTILFLRRKFDNE